ncbi:MAG: hypothetical protein M1821_008394 [Bathelium mastoideum]|nr:MAG: hypothetical protein M1821_008394 [Bathelium mastoideum]
MDRFFDKDVIVMYYMSDEVIGSFSSRHEDIFSKAEKRNRILVDALHQFFPPYGEKNDLGLENPNRPNVDDKDYVDSIINLKSEDIKSIENALHRFKSLGVDIPLVSPENFPLPETLVARLRSFSEIVHNGAGFVTVRGINPENYNEEDNAIIFRSLSSYVGCLQSTNQSGVSMSDLRDASRDHWPEGRRIAELKSSKLPQGLKFHADRFYGDVIATYVRSDDAAGSEQYLASFRSIYNELHETSPQTLRILAPDWSWGGHTNNSMQLGDATSPPQQDRGQVVQFDLVKLKQVGNDRRVLGSET